MKISLNEVNNNWFFMMRTAWTCNFVKLVCTKVADMYHMVAFMFTDILDCLKKRNDTTIQ